jgi:hypothetical protein
MECSFRTLFPKLCGEEYSTECAYACSASLFLTKVDYEGLLWPRLSGAHMQLAKKKLPKTTLKNASDEEWSGLNFLEKAGMKAASRIMFSTLNDTYAEEQQSVRNNIAKNVSSDQWTKTASINQQQKKDGLLTKYGGLSLVDLDSKKKKYWLYVDQLIPPCHKFRQYIEDEYEQDWAKIDGRKMFTQSKMESFQWRVYHGKLYARKDLLRFGSTQDSKCNYCDEELQSVKNLYLSCPRISVLFKNFEKQYGLSQLSNCERLIGVDTRESRDLIVSKRLGILRRCIYECNHECRVPKWEEVLNAVDRLYIVEYGIAEKAGRVDKAGPQGMGPIKCDHKAEQCKSIVVPEDQKNIL